MSIKLNQSQKIATEHIKGAMLVLSGPGSGKTTVITHRVKNLIEKHNIDPNQILVITFTKAAAQEMKSRFLSLVSCEQVYFGTFHSIFFKIIRNYYNYSLNDILHDNDKKVIIKKIIYDLKVNFDDEEEFLQNIINEISILKNDLIQPIHFDSDTTEQHTFREIYVRYEKAKQDANKIDFDDMLIKCYELLKKEEKIRKFWSEKYKYILIDEFQDINRVQYEAIKLLVTNEQNIFIVGDDDQSIYSFRGSSPEFLFEFPKDFNLVKTITLNINYRSTDQIINLCNSIIKDNSQRYEKEIKGTGIRHKMPILLRNYDVNEEAKKVVEKILKAKKNIPLEEIAIIYRTNIQSRAIIETLLDHNIEFQIKDKASTIYEHFVAKDIMAYLKLAINKVDNESFMKIANKPKRYINKSLINEAINHCKNNSSALEYIYCHKEIKSWQLENINNLLFHLGQIKNKTPYLAIQYILSVVKYQEYLEEYANFKNIKSNGLFQIVDELLDSSKEHTEISEFLTYIENIITNINAHTNQNQNNSGVVLTTMHSAKGLEFDTVFVIGCVDGVIPHEKSKSSLQIEEERRLFYVALTRAKKNLYISILKSKYESEAKPSRFLNRLIK